MCVDELAIRKCAQAEPVWNQADFSDTRHVIGILGGGYNRFNDYT